MHLNFTTNFSFLYLIVERNYQLFQQEIEITKALPNYLAQIFQYQLLAMRFVLF